MAINIEDFGAFEQDGISIERDTLAREGILKMATQVLSEKRFGTELDDHMSDEMHCLRKTVLSRIKTFQTITDGNKRSDRTDYHEIRIAESPTWGVKYHPQDLVSQHDPQEVIWFGFGHSMQDFFYGDKAEVAIWDGIEKLWYSPDGVNLLADGDTHEFKTTRKWHMTAPARKENKTVEQVIIENNPSWFQYMLAVMHFTGKGEYYLTVGWISGADLETFKVTASEDAVYDNWERLKYYRNLKRDSINSFVEEVHKTGFELKELGDDGVFIPDTSTRLGDFECRNCPFLMQEPCRSEILPLLK